MKPIPETMINTYNRTLYTYVIMLKQFGAKYSDSELMNAALEIEGIYNNLSNTEEINDKTLQGVEDGLLVLKIGTLNLQITICNKKYNDISPVCDAISEFVEKINSDIKRYKLM